jgi:hypothetical protein
MTALKDDVALNSAAYWRKRAEESRNMVDGMSDEFARPMMLEIVRMYEKLARRAEEQEKDRSKRS